FADRSSKIRMSLFLHQLKEFQQKTTPSTGSAGPKKKRKVKGGDQLDAAADGHLPENVSQELEETSAEPVSNPASVINTECVADNAGLQVCLSQSPPLSSTESLRQISQQLNGLLSESATYINGDSDPPAVSEKELETRNQELAAALDSSGLTNAQLSSKLETLTKQSQELSDQLQKERKEFEQKFTKEQGAMREQLQVNRLHRTEVMSCSLINKYAGTEAEDLSSRLQASKQRVSELERTLSSVSTQQKQFEKHNRELEKERDSLRLEVLRFSKVSEESRQQSSELSEQLKLRVNENNGLKQEVDELRKQLEMADSMLQQFSSQSGPPSGHQQVQLLLEEKHQLEAHAAQLMESVAQLQVERDQYAGQIQEEGRVWKDKTEQLLSQVHKHTHTYIIVRDNEQLSRLVQEQEVRLEELERHAGRAAEEAQDRLRILEDVQSDKATISRAVAQNRDLKDQLAELQNGFVKLTNENMELTSALQSEQHIKKEIARKIGQLQEDLHGAKEQLQEKCGELASVQEQRDQCLVHLQQYTAGYQQLVAEREHLHHQVLQQAQLMDRLQHDEVQGKVQLEQSHVQLQEAQEKLNQLARDNEELKTEVQELLNSSALNTSHRDEGDGLESRSLPESFQKSHIVIPEDFESREEMEEFVHSALSRLEEERDEMSRRFEEERRLHHTLRQQMTATSHEQQQHHPHPHSTAGSDGVPVEVHEALRGAMEKLQERFTALMQEKVDLRERVEELEHRCIQLSGETDTIGETPLHYEKEQYINTLAKDEEEMKAKLAELQDLVMRLVGERNEWYSRYMSAVGNPDLVSSGGERLHPADGHTDSPAVLGLSAAEDVSTEPQSSTDPHTGRPGSAPDGPSLRATEDGTARQIMQLLQEIQTPQARPAPFLGENSCIPFFYRPDEQDEVKILVV
uniref:Golgin A2 n=1 Tax=Cyprinus carpio TaxID=7962 RepID=A0A8C1SL83_CYPCA